MKELKSVAMGIGKLGCFEQGVVFENSSIRVLLDNIESVPVEEYSGVGFKIILKIESKIEDILTVLLESGTIKLNDIYYSATAKGTGPLMPYSYTFLSIIVPYENILTDVDNSECELNTFKIIPPIKISTIGFNLRVVSSGVLDNDIETCKIVLRDKYGSISYLDFISKENVDILTECSNITIGSLGYFEYLDDYKLVLLIKNNRSFPISVTINYGRFKGFKRLDSPILEKYSLGLVLLSYSDVADFVNSSVEFYAYSDDKIEVELIDKYNISLYELLIEESWPQSVDDIAKYFGWSKEDMEQIEELETKASIPESLKYFGLPFEEKIVCENNFEEFESVENIEDDDNMITIKMTKEEYDCICELVEKELKDEYTFEFIGKPLSEITGLDI